MKAEILKMLKEDAGYLSGQQLCEKLGVSRTAVWKAIRQLEEEGYKIEAVRNRGYRLVHQADVITSAELKTMLHTKWVGNRIVYFDETDSTNIQARKLAEEGAPHGTLVVADAQLAGKGRRGRNWISPHGTGIWMSLILRPNIAPASASMLTLVAGMAVTEGVLGMPELKEARKCYEKEHTEGSFCQIKWPNDVVVGGKKICGILTEMSTEEDSIRHVVIGIGINANTEEFPQEVASTATSLKRELGFSLKRSHIISAVWEAFEREYARFLVSCDMSELKEEYNGLCANCKRQVQVLHPAGAYQAEALGIDNEGCLLVKKEDGTMEAVLSGEVSVRGIYGYV